MTLQATFTYTGAVQTWTVPAGVTSVWIDCYGAQGAAGGSSGAAGGLGGWASGGANVTPGQTLYVYVGGAGVGGTGGFNGGGAGTGGGPGGGGGGASDVRTVSGSLASRLVVGGGGGGGGGGAGSGAGGAGGGSTGATGGTSGGQSGGGGGTQSAGGSGPNSGALGVGASGTSGSGGGGGGGGGGGFYGGAGGAGAPSFQSGGGGGGGSNGPAATIAGGQNIQGYRVGHGEVWIRWEDPPTPITPKTTATNWSTRAGVAAAPVAVTWRVLSRFTIGGPTTTWAALVALAATVAVTWNTDAATEPLEPVAASVATIWQADGRIVNSAGTAWNTRALVAAPVATTWGTRAGVQQTRATSWTTRVRLTTTIATLWAINERKFVISENFSIQIETTPGSWVDVTGTGHRFEIVRHDGDPGTLQCEILDAALDPVTSSALSMGDAVRVRVKKGTGWATVYTGQINDLEVDVNPHTRPTSRQTNVKLTATDNVSKLSNTTEARGVATINELRWIVGTTVPYVINGSSAAGTGTVVATNDNASLWDQILVTRDTALGFAWVDPDNALRVYDAASMSSAVKATLTPAVYTDLDRDFTLDQVLNEVTVQWRRYNIGTETSSDVPYGPYRDVTSIAKWGARTATFTIQGPAVEEDEATVSAYASTILARNSTAEHRAKSATIAAIDASRLALVRDLDLNALVSVTYQDGATVKTLRVVGISHAVDIRAGEGTVWITTLTFANPTGIAMPTATPGTGIAYVPPGSIGPDELDPDLYGDITDAATQADDALTQADAAFTSATAANLQIEGWKYTGTTKIDGGDIQTDTIRAGQITADAITGKHTITGATIQTDARSNRGVKIVNPIGLIGYSDGSGGIPAGAATFSIDATTGAAVFRGSILSGSTITGADIVGTSSITGANISTAAYPDSRLTMGPAWGTEGLRFWIGTESTPASSIIFARSLELYATGGQAVWVQSPLKVVGGISELYGKCYAYGGVEIQAASNLVAAGTVQFTGIPDATASPRHLMIGASGVLQKGTTVAITAEEVEELRDRIAALEARGGTP